MSILKGKVAIIVGSSKGIGYDIARVYLLNACKVVICSRRQSNVDTALKQLKETKGINSSSVIGKTCHVANEKDRKSVIDLTMKTFGRIDIFVENVAVNPNFRQNILEVKESLWKKIMEVNVISMALFIKDVFPFMKKTGGGKIITMSSISAYNGATRIGAYAVSKTAVVSLTQHMCHPLADHNIQINCISPGIIETNFAAKIFTNRILKSKLLPLIPLGRFGQVNDVSGVALFLASSDSDYMTGETISVAGGNFSRL